MTPGACRPSLLAALLAGLLLAVGAILTAAILAHLRWWAA